MIPDGPAAGRPAIVTAAQACEAILTLSGTTNGRVAVEGFRHMEERTGQQLADLALDNEGKRISFADTQARRCRSSPARSGPAVSTVAVATRRSRSTWSGSKPWHTLTGRQSLFPRPRLDDRDR